MANSWLKRLFTPRHQPISRLRSTVAVGGSIYRISDLRTNSDIEDIRTQILVMRALARDSQVSTALSYYATDATTPNTAGDIIWATALEPKYQQVADVVNDCFKRWNINNYASDHIIELITVGQFYMPTTEMYRGAGVNQRRELMSLDDNTLINTDYDIIPSYMIPPEDVIHVWYRGQPQGYIYQPSDTGTMSGTEAISYPESSIIHFSLGGLLGKYHITAQDSKGETLDYDIQFADPLMSQAVQPTQTLNLLEDALLLSSMSRAVKFVNVECGDLGEEDEIGLQLQKIKDKIEQQLALNTASGDVQSFVNPQSPNNLIYLARVNGQDAISITDMNMAETSESDNKLLDYYQNKKLSVLGIPKEAMNFSSAEGLGAAGNVMSQRSALYANRLMRVENAYKNGWKDALNKYFLSRNMGGFVDKFILNMNPIITNMDQVLFEKRDATISQAQNLVNLMKELGVADNANYQKAVTEILTQAFPQTGSSVNNWDVDVQTGEEAAGGGGFGGL